MWWKVWKVWRNGREVNTAIVICSDSTGPWHCASTTKLFTRQTRPSLNSPYTMVQRTRTGGYITWTAHQNRHWEQWPIASTRQRTPDIQFFTRTSQDSWTHGPSCTASSWRRHGRTPQRTETHRQGWAWSQTPHQRSRSPAASCSLRQCCTRARSRRALRTPGTSRRRSSGCTGSHQCCPEGLQGRSTDCACPRHGRFCPGSLLRRCAHLGAMPLRMSSPDGRLG